MDASVAKIVASAKRDRASKVWAVVSVPWRVTKEGRSRKVNMGRREERKKGETHKRC